MHHAGGVALRRWTWRQWSSHGHVCVCVCMKCPRPIFRPVLTLARNWRLFFVCLLIFCWLYELRSLFSESVEMNKSWSWSSVSITILTFTIIIIAVVVTAMVMIAVPNPHQESSLSNAVFSALQEWSYLTLARALPDIVIPTRQRGPCIWEWLSVLYEVTKWVTGQETGTQMCLMSKPRSSKSYHVASLRDLTNHLSK